MRLIDAIKTVTAIVILSLGTTSAMAEVVVVVSLQNPVVMLTSSQVVNIFLGRTSHFPGDTPADPVDQVEGRAAREDFYRGILGWSPAQIKAHWSKMIFTGRGQPPEQLANDEEVKQFVAETPAAIGYIDKRYVDEDVKIVNVVR